MPKYITMYFELGMIRAINPKFPESRIIGCYFHFKQAINKKLPKLKISNQDAPTILEKIELLTLVSINEMDIAINFIKSLTSNNLNLNNSGNIFSQHGLIGRMNDHFLNSHSNICIFVEVIRNEFEFYEQHCLEIRQTDRTSDP
ncbi:hypothetical protein HZS_2038 [Henneguya salminicola]|nr:hypothetical protein HZS_2038 [Henneguya salminicola]